MAQVAEKAPFVYDASLEDQEADAAFENPTPGNVLAVLVDVVPLGWMVQKAFKEGDPDKEVFKMDLIFQIEEVNQKGYRFTPRRRVTLSLNEKATFRKYFEAIVGRTATGDEQTGKTKVTPKSLFPYIGKTSVLLNLIQPPDSKYVNIDAITTLPKGMTGLDPLNYTRVKDR
jgi:hypothetical protein